MSLGLIVRPETACAYDFENDGLCYNILLGGEKEVEVTFLSNRISVNSRYVSGNLVIPSEVIYAGQNCVVSSIGNNSFYYCSALSSVSIPESIKSIGEYAFSGCSDLSHIFIPKSVRRIANITFGECANLVDIVVDEENLQYASVDGSLYTKDIDTLLCCPGGKSAIAIPESVRSIGYGAFFACLKLTSLIIPDSVTSIENAAFLSCLNLSSIVIGKSVVSIASSAFSNCNSIKSLCCKAKTPPIVDSSNFSNVVYSNSILYVPTGTKAAYEQVDPWRNFWNIEEMDFEDATGIERVTTDEAEASVTTENGVIVIEGGSRLPVEVYSVGGQCLYRGTDRRIAGLPGGVYVVKIGNRSQKIVL